MAGKDQTTPLMKQYLEIKGQNQGSILFFRMGDFYEMFYEDAKTAAEVLGITLTSRSSGKAGAVPLAGFPYHSLDNYLAKMIKAGYRVAICEQVEDPKKAKTIVKRAVTEIVTPGTALADELLDSRQNNYLSAVFFEGNDVGMATVDVSTGEFRTSEIPRGRFNDYLTLVRPAEILISDEQQELLRSDGVLPDGCVLSPVESWVFNRDYAYEKLTRHFQTLTLKGFGCEDMSGGVSAAGAILHYLQENQQSHLEHLSTLYRDQENHFVGLDKATQRNLELAYSLSGDKRGALVSVLDQTLTPMGARLLRNWLLRPLINVQEITKRLDAVEELLQDRGSIANFAESLSRIGDVERLNTKVTTQRANARDLNALAASLEKIDRVKTELSSREAKYLAEIHSSLDPLPTISEEVRQAIEENPPLAITDGGVIRRGFHEELDRLREIKFSGKDWILQLQKSEREKTGIPSLKVNYNKVFGYYIEVTKPNLPRVPEHYIRKQTLVNAERFITPELKEYEEQILDAEEKIIALEYELFQTIRQHVATESLKIQTNARMIAALDCLLNFARLADENKYCRPSLNDSNLLEIVEGRHPVIEKLLPFGEKFVANDTQIGMDDSQVQIITGPNMAGKSTYLRQVALIVLMAQIGSFVPAKSATIGVVDKIFTRVGASDNLAAGESTFLVEMNETANILNNATQKSLILLDEIGRGTSTFDGLSIAWSVVEYLHENDRVAAKTMFATHYHELTELEMILPRVKNYNIAVKEWGDQIIFLRKIVEGGADHSYGIQVAKLAGLPSPVIYRAREILSNLEQNALTPNHKPKIALKRKSKTKDDRNQLDFFAQEKKELVEDIKRIDLNNLTPMQALLKLAEMKEKFAEK